MTEASERNRKPPTMAELDVLERQQQSCRRSARQSNLVRAHCFGFTSLFIVLSSALLFLVAKFFCNDTIFLQSIKTSKFRRLHEIFWKGDELYDNERNTNSDDSSDEDRSATSSRKRKRADASSTLPQIFGKLSYTKVHDSPHIYVMDRFLSERELSYCESKILKAKQFSKSVVDKSSGDTVVVEQQRTSTYLHINKMEHSCVASMERRAAELLDMSVQQLEPLQLVRYHPGQFFGLHHDMGILYEDGSVELPEKRPWAKRRLVTVFVYLNEVCEGGCTHFPLLNLRVKPKRGRAVLFCNIDKHGMPDPRTVHSGEEVLQTSHNVDKKQTQESKDDGALNDPNVKYGINIWACED